MNLTTIKNNNSKNHWLNWFNASVSLLYDNCSQLTTTLVNWEQLWTDDNLLDAELTYILNKTQEKN